MNISKFIPLGNSPKTAATSLKQPKKFPSKQYTNGIPPYIGKQ